MLNTETQQVISEDTGIPFAEISGMDWEEIDRRIEQKIGKKLEFCPSNDTRRNVRGSVLLNFRRMIFRNDIEKRLETMKSLSGVY